ncbi:cell division protein FtsQ [Flavobacterium sp. SUN052]|uniref:cell division protein FtsQ/DivIB n=1 Tax=Flavobacterium sp. SUN052 TaxID=3002441 RepID=UPI00237E011D|nr:cell division protein FtsQ [Flavobacterium sp. SUN052]MEC4003077.1 cell division protein FtsQ [Flavobacterium sp. SUN052]
MKFFNWINIRLILMFVLVIFLYSFTSNRNSQRKLKKSEVVFVGENNDFVEQKTVNKLLIENNNDVRTIAKSDLNLNKLENSINKHPMVEKSEVFVTVDGVLKAVVKQKTPIARVFDEFGSFYIDYEGNKMPLSDINTARVPLISGDITDKNKKKLSEILKMIYDDEFLKKNIIGVQILTGDDLIMTNRNFDYQIEFGKMVNEERKFKNYKAFFQKAVLDSTLYKYKKINLRFTQQVVCTK